MQTLRWDSDWHYVLWLSHKVGPELRGCGEEHHKLVLTAAPKIATALMDRFRNDFGCARCVSMFRCVGLTSFISAKTALGCMLLGNETRLCHFIFNIVPWTLQLAPVRPVLFIWFTHWLFHTKRAFGCFPADVPSGGVLAAAVSRWPPAERIRRYPDRALQSLGRNVHGGERTRWRAPRLMRWGSWTVLAPQQRSP